MLDVGPVAWTITIAVIIALFVLDLVIARRPHEVTFREAVSWTVFYTIAGLAFVPIFAAYSNGTFAGEYFAGYVVERSLSIDNLFVFVIIMNTFSVPAEHQQRVLTFGIIAALVLRAIFIAIGAALLSAFSVMFLVFGLILVATAIQLFRHRDEDPSVEDNVMVSLARRWLPFTDRYDGRNLVTRVEGRRALTPLFLVLVAIGSTDIVFALDSIPAVFGVTEEAYIVFVANAFALLGLRPLYFLVSGLLDRLVYLSIGLSIVLGFIGVKLILEYAHTLSDSVPEISTNLSLIVIVVILAVTIVASLIKATRDPTARAHAGSLRGHPEAEEAPGS